MTRRKADLAAVHGERMFDRAGLVAACPLECRLARHAVNIQSL